MLNPVKTGAAFGLLIGLVHAAWATLVAFGWAQPLIRFVLDLHMLRIPVKVAPFDPGQATMLVLFTGGFGFVLGAAFACFWNLAHRQVELAPRPAPVLH
jgi:hypothetical protein